MKDDNGIVGFLMRKDAMEVQEESEATTIGQIAQKNYVVVNENALLFEVITEMRSQKVPAAIVTSDEDENQVVGLIFKEQLADVWLETHELFAG